MLTEQDLQDKMDKALKDSKSDDPEVKAEAKELFHDLLDQLSALQQANKETAKTKHYKSAVKKFSASVKSGVLSVVDSWPDELKEFVLMPSEDAWAKGPVHAMGAIFHLTLENLRSVERKAIKEKETATAKVIGKLHKVVANTRATHTNTVDDRIKFLQKERDEAINQIRREYNVKLSELRTLRKKPPTELPEEAQIKAQTADFDAWRSACAAHYQVLVDQLNEIKSHFDLPKKGN